MAHFPDYIWDPDSGRLYVTESGEPFQNSGEYLDGPATFLTKDDAYNYLKQYGCTGTLGVKFK
tara:strand:+ start:3887 stop:4075 length:189 start_codon:yes stop_codon:yes gene_type:complete